MKLFRRYLLFSCLLTAFPVTVLAENSEYRLYNPSTGRTTIAQMMTIGIGNNEYVIGLTPPTCGIVSVAKNKDGLWEGKCSFQEQDYYWKELYPNTFFSEVNTIKRERAKEGLYLRK